MKIVGNYNLVDKKNARKPEIYIIIEIDSNYTLINISTNGKFVNIFYQIINPTKCNKS